MPTKTELEKLLERFRLHVEQQAAKMAEQAVRIAEQDATIAATTARAKAPESRRGAKDFADQRYHS